MQNAAFLDPLGALDCVLRSGSCVLRSAAFFVQLRSESCVQLRSAFTCVLRSGSCVLRSGSCVLRSAVIAFTCVLRSGTCVLRSGCCVRVRLRSRSAAFCVRLRSADIAHRYDLKQRRQIEKLNGPIHATQCNAIAIAIAMASSDLTGARSSTARPIRPLSDRIGYVSNTKGRTGPPSSTT
eukprot:gene13545-biopygen12107